MKTKHRLLVLTAVLILETAAHAADGYRAREAGVSKSVQGSGEALTSFPPSAQGRMRTFTNLAVMHDNYSDDFAKKPGFGMSRILYLPPQDFLTLNGETYRFDSPDLLGLEDEPVAYQRRGIETITMAVVSKKELRSHLQRRPLTVAEFSAVAELRAGKDLVTMPKAVEVVTQHETNRVTGLLAVGALRAKAHCAECHQVKEGTLLGAFSYTLVPTNPAASSALTRTGESTRGIRSMHASASRQTSPIQLPGNLTAMSEAVTVSAPWLMDVQPAPQSNRRLPRATNILDRLITDSPGRHRPVGMQGN